MADVAIYFAVLKLGEALFEKMSFPEGLEDQVRWLKDELEKMQCFLKDAAEKQGNDERTTKWISDIRQLAHDAEDAIETFVLKVDRPRKFRGLLRRVACLPVHVSYLNRFGEEILSIRNRLDEIDKSRWTYRIESLQGDGQDKSKRLSENVELRRRLSPSQQDRDVVGLDEDVEQLLRTVILEKSKGLLLVAILGIGGIGKSTLAKKIYNHPDVVAEFECRAWVVVSSEFTPEDIIKQIMLQLQNSSEERLNVLETTKRLQEATNDKLSLQENLQEMLHKQLLGKRYFIVLDDVWEQTHWEPLRSAFPDEQDKASRLLFTSRNQIISRQQGHIHKMRLLDPDESWELLKRQFVVRPEQGKVPQELEKVGREILKKCGGLPLAIKVAGGLLVNYGESKSGWEKALRELNHLSRSGSSVLSAILELSYHNLSPELKACFLCLGFFKEDAVISARRLGHIWIAEGFIPQGEETMEEIARGYLDKLINRNLVQVRDVNKLNNGVKNCHVHDLLRDLSVRKAKEEISFEVLKEDYYTTSQSSLDRPRHRAIYYSGDIGTWLMNSSSVNPNSSWRRHLRSLFFNGDGIFIISPSYWKSFELLRVLEFGGFTLRNLPEAIGTLIELRYLGLKGTPIHILPGSLGRLKKLEVLDVGWKAVKVSNVLWKMDSLRHIYALRIKVHDGSHLKIQTLRNLQTMKYIQLSDWIMVEYPTPMTNSIRKLGIELDVELQDGTMLSSSLATMKNLLCLDLVGSYYPNLNGFHQLNHLTKLRLKGSMKALPSASDFPPNISCLSLVDTFLKYDPMPVLEKMHKLEYIVLDGAYLGEEMEISNDAFPVLRVLYLGGLSNLSNIRLGKGGMPELKRLELYQCHNLDPTYLPKNMRMVMTNLYVPK